MIRAEGLPGVGWGIVIRAEGLPRVGRDESRPSKQIKGGSGGRSRPSEGVMEVEG